MSNRFGAYFARRLDGSLRRWRRRRHKDGLRHIRSNGLWHVRSNGFGLFGDWRGLGDSDDLRLLVWCWLLGVCRRGFVVNRLLGRCFADRCGVIAVGR